MPFKLSGVVDDAVQLHHKIWAPVHGTVDIWQKHSTQTEMLVMGLGSFSVSPCAELSGVDLVSHASCREFHHLHIFEVLDACSQFG